jgi:hypothetical protein
MKQAVVIIHGIGEQKPMSTLRSFVRAVLGPPPAGRDNYWSKPDPMSELFELRRLQAIGRPKTQFYEYYWAYNVEGTTIWQVVAWLWSLICRSGKDVPRSALSLWWLLRILAVVFAVLTATGVTAGLWDWKQALKLLSLPWVLVVACGGGIYFFLLYYLGDAARYCSANPQNIRLRQTIRAEGLKLLRTLHESGEYGRIIVVGHSLGSVIGYDLVKRLWQEYHELYPGLEKDSKIQAAVRAAMDRKEGLQHEMRDGISALGEALQASSDDEQVKAYQAKQQSVLAELQFMGNPWRISDFITLGCPLVHMMLLLADSKDDFEDRKRQREFPTCPPQPDDKGYAFSGKVPVELGDGKKFTPLYLHHAAPFAVTRWTNLYFPARFGLFGDIVGGPLRPELGHGILDLPVRTQALSGFMNHTLLAHTSYWDERNFHSAAGDASSRKLALAALREALALSHLRAQTARRDEGVVPVGEQINDHGEN